MKRGREIMKTKKKEQRRGRMSKGEGERKGEVNRERERGRERGKGRQ